VRDSDGLRSQRWKSAASGRGRLALTGMAVVLSLTAAACSVGGNGGGSHDGGKPAAATTQVSISPANGATDLHPGSGITVTARHGRLSHVTVTTGGSAVPGVLAAGGSAWHSQWPLETSAHYTVTATAVGAGGKSVTETSSFATFTPSRTYSVMIYEGYRQVYGVGMPILLKFSRPVTRRSARAAVERAMEIHTSKPVVGAWYWLDGYRELDFRPRNYWPAHTHVSFTGHFDGLAIAPGVYGTANLTQQFTIGNSLIVVASTARHYMKVWYKGKLLGNWPISTGQPRYPTANGTYLTIDKHNPTLMTGPGYKNFPVPYAVRFTWSGNYIHDAYWSVAQQGVVNVSFGCVNVAPAQAKLYYELAHPGDPVTIIGSPAAGQWLNGWTDWFLTWQQVLKRSAIPMAVEVGPGGSRFVSPSAVPGKVLTSILHGSRPGNYLAG
jgi:lipoprotein-anchoring transpeptidase ErfK/SrfK